MRRVLAFVLCAGSAWAALFFIASVVQADTAPVGAVVISELMWDGTEYLELFNTTSEDIALSGWSITRQQAGGEAKTVVRFDEGDVIEAGGYFLVEKKEEATTVVADKVVSGLTLVNTGELASLFDDGENVVDVASQLGSWFAGQNTEEGVAMERVDGESDGTKPESWHDSTGSIGGRVGTPGTTNSEAPVNHPPEAVVDPSTATAVVGEAVSFSAEDSVDPDSDELTYTWGFGDGSSASGASVTHTYTSAGVYTVMLTVSDSEFEDEATATVTVETLVYADTVVVNEFLPNPVGSDTAAEFVEIKNLGAAAVGLSGWQLDDQADGGSKPYTVSDGVVIGAGSITVFSRVQTKLALNNGGDTVRLLAPDSTVKSSFAYSSAVAEGQSYNRTAAGSYVLSTTVTEGKENVITAPQDSDVEDESGTENSTVSAAAGAVAGTSVNVVALTDVREEELGTRIETEGVVSVPPGVFGEKIIYLAGSGVQVYFHDENYPQLVVGSRVKVRGELASYLDETRIKLAQASDVTVVGSGDAPTPHQAKTGEIDEELEGTLVTISGKVTSTQGSTFYVDDGSGEVKVFIKESTKIDKPKTKKDTVVTVTGVVSQTKSGYRILPRFQEDVRLGTVAGLTSFPKTGVLLFWVGLSVLVAWLAAALGQRAREPLAVG